MTNRFTDPEPVLFIVGDIHVEIYERLVDGAREFKAWFGTEPTGDTPESMYTDDHLEDLATAAKAADIVIACTRGSMCVFDAARQLVRLGVVR